MKSRLIFPLTGWLLCWFLITSCQASGERNSQSGAVAQQADQMLPGDSLPVRGFLFGDDHPFPQCHASTIIHLKNGEFVAAWFGGTHEKADDVGIWMTKGRPGHWEKPFEVAKLQQVPHWNPVLFQAPDGKIFLFFKVGKEIAQWETWVKVSTDEGKTWSDAHELVKGDKGGRGPVRNKMIVLSDGAWLAGASNENGPWNAFFDRSEDQGKTWVATPYLKIDHDTFKGKGVIQPTLWESAPGQVHALLRSTAGVICRTDSKDGGKTWSAVYETALPNPNSAIDVTKLPDGTLVLAFNPTTRDGGSRGRLSLGLSFDNGKTWPKILDLENEDRHDEFSYPAIIHWGDSVAVTYTWKRKKIAYWIGTEAQLKRDAKSFQSKQ